MTILATTKNAGEMNIGHRCNVVPVSHVWDTDPSFRSDLRGEDQVRARPLRRTRCQGDIRCQDPDYDSGLVFELDCARRRETADSLMLGTLFATALLGGIALGSSLGGADLNTSSGVHVPTGTSVVQQAR